MRTITPLKSGWVFVKSAADALSAAAADGQAVTLPHTWNATDGQDGGNDYYRGTCYYVKSLTRPELQNGHQVYLEFNGAAFIADVYVNGRHLAHHAGGYSTFRVNITGVLADENTIVVTINNEDNSICYPQKADFTFYGGLYRMVNMIVVPETHFELDYCGTPGIKVTPRVDLDTRTAVVAVEAWVTSETQAAADASATADIQATAEMPAPANTQEAVDSSAPTDTQAVVDSSASAGTQTAAGASASVEIQAAAAPLVTFTVAGQAKTVPATDHHAQAVFTIPDVHLWNGLNDPYLYTAAASLDSGDQVSTRFGCREFHIDPEKGFFLNGCAYPLRGVSRHQDFKGIGNALTMEQHLKDMEIIRELGATTLRLAHYQHAQEFYDLCDENGLIVWAEIPYITMHMKNARQNTLTQMEELIVQNYNHPSIITWGLSNEITAASAVDDDLLENHRLLNDLCHRLDATRPTVMANVFMLETDSPLLTIPDMNSYNLYFGWYLGELEQNEEFFDDYHKKYPDRIIGFSEYGADANPKFQSAEPEKGDYTESYQALYHEHMLKMIEERPYLWATHVWNLFDFAADGRDEGGKHGVNQKGLVTMDRQTKKDAFYLYKAAWNRTGNFVHLCGRRYAERTEAVTEIKVYSNQPEVTLYVDGQKFGTQSGETVFRFQVPLTGSHESSCDGTHDASLDITARAAGCEDHMVIRKVSEPNPDYVFVQRSSVTNWFDGGALDPDCFSINDRLSDIRQNPQAGPIIDQMMAKSAAERGDVADAVKDNPALQRMMGRMTLISLLKQSGADEESIRQLNRVLQGIKK